MASTNEPPKPKPPTPEVLKKPKGMTRKGFGDLIKRAFRPDAPKPSPKS
jgi:hypothetical protein